MPQWVANRRRFRQTIGAGGRAEAISECFRNSSISFTSKLLAEQTVTIPNKAGQEPNSDRTDFASSPRSRRARSACRSTAGLSLSHAAQRVAALAGRVKQSGNKLKLFATGTAAPCRAATDCNSLQPTRPPRPPPQRRNQRPQGRLFDAPRAHRRPRRSIKLRRAMGSRGGSRPLAGCAPGAGFVGE